MHYGWIYSDFEKRAVSIRGNEEMVTVELVPVKNTQKDWQEITSSNTDCMCRIYTVDLSDADVSDSYIENLQYFFIRADRVSSPAQNAPQLGLLVQGNADNVYRARIYLSLLGGITPAIIFYTVLAISHLNLTATTVLPSIIPQMS